MAVLSSGGTSTSQKSEGLLVPADKGLRPYDHESVLPTKELGCERHRDPGGIIETLRFLLALHEGGELLLVKEDLGSQGGARLEKEAHETDPVSAQAGEDATTIADGP